MDDRPKHHGPETASTDEGEAHGGGAVPSAGRAPFVVLVVLSSLWHLLVGAVAFLTTRGALYWDYLVLAWGVLAVVIGIFMVDAVVRQLRARFWVLVRFGALAMLVTLGPAAASGGTPLVVIGIYLLLGALGFYVGCSALLRDE